MPHKSSSHRIAPLWNSRQLSGNARRQLALSSCQVATVNTVCSSGASGDPHIAFANGGKADFRGTHREYYAFISSPGYQFAPHFQEVDFFFDTVTGLRQLVHGTFMTKAAWRVRTSSGKELFIHADAMHKGELTLLVQSLATGLKTITVTPWQRLAFDDVHIETRMLTVSVESPTWQVNITSKPIYGLVPPLFNETHVHGHWEEEQRRYDINIYGSFPQPNAHGIIGQSYRDSVVRNGKLDNYGILNFTEVAEGVDSDGMLPPMTTSAQAEGAIEGTYTDYRLSGPMLADFVFSRYHHIVKLPETLSKRESSTTEWDGKRWAGKKREL